MYNRFRIKIIDKSFRNKAYVIYDKLNNKIYVESYSGEYIIYRKRELAYRRRNELNKKWNLFIEKGTLKRL